ncbi:hypothetical protein CsSME_00038858 [Camellia sinensis var. sinensis]
MVEYVQQDGLWKSCVLDCRVDRDLPYLSKEHKEGEEDIYSLSNKQNFVTSAAWLSDFFYTIAFALDDVCLDIYKRIGSSPDGHCDISTNRMGYLPQPATSFSPSSPPPLPPPLTSYHLLFPASSSTSFANPCYCLLFPLPTIGWKLHLYPPPPLRPWPARNPILTKNYWLVQGRHVAIPLTNHNSSCPLISFNHPKQICRSHLPTNYNIVGAPHDFAPRPNQ